MGKYGATCTYTFHEENRDLEKAAWDQLRFGMIATNAANFAGWKAAILKLCAYSKICTYGFVKEVETVMTRIDKMVERRNKICKAAGDCPKTGLHERALLLKEFDLN